MCLLLVRFILQKCVRRSRLCYSCVILLIAPINALANLWTFQPGIDLGEIYSDNITLATSQQASDEFVTEVDPRFSIKGKGRRLKLNLDYRMQNLLYASDSRRNATYHQLDADGASTIVENLLYFDVGGSIGQQVISPNANVPIGNISITGNRTNYTTYQVRPYIHHNFGASAAVDIRYNHNRVNYTAENLPSSRADQYVAKLYNGSGFHRVTWSVTHSEQKTVYDRYPNVTLKSSQAQVGYFVTSTMNFFGTLGYEDNNYVSASKNSGRTWNVGVRWNPSPRTTVSASYGKRFFGSNYFGEFKHRSRLVEWDASYEEEITSVRDMQLATHTLGFVDTSGNVTLVNVTFPQLTSETFVRKHSELSMTRKLRSGNLTVQFYDDQRHFQSSGDQEHVYGNKSSVLWSLDQRTKLNINVGWQRFGYRSGNRSDDFWYSSIGITHDVSRKVNAEFTFQHNSRSSTEDSTEYVENRISAFIHANF